MSSFWSLLINHSIVMTTAILAVYILLSLFSWLDSFFLWLLLRSSSTSLVLVAQNMGYEREAGRTFPFATPITNSETSPVHLRLRESRPWRSGSYCHWINVFPKSSLFYNRLQKAPVWEPFFALPNVSRWPYPLKVFQLWQTLTEYGLWSIRDSITIARFL